MALSRSDSVRRGESDRVHRNSTGGHHVHFAPHLERPELQQFQKSSTSQLRTLSKFADENAGEDFSIKTRDQEVAGLHGRRRLQRGATVRAKKTTVGYAGRTWMDTQRQFLQAYEYLCHIGEAKEWIEDIIQKPIPPIVELEQALRDGVTLAEIVESLQPERRFRIFRHPKLQFRHSDNIAIFFRFLQQVELPDLFWFELVDLYEKKNIPKVIYCIHALSWLLFRKGITDFRIGNLVGQLQFEDHELEAMQKGLDKAGINMPNFSGMGANFGAEPEPEPVETEDERIDRELTENEHAIADLQAQIRGAMVRIRLGDTMQNLWDAESWITELQAKIRGDFSREIAQYRLDMRRFAVNLQAAARGFLVRWQASQEQDYWQDREHQVVLLQSLVRAKKARAETNYIKSKVQRQEHGIRELQAAIRGALKRRDVGDEVADANDAEPFVQQLQAAIRGALSRKRVDDQLEDAREAEAKIEKLQSALRGMLQRRAMQTDRTHVRQHESMISKLQAAARAAIARKEQAEIRANLEATAGRWEELQSIARGRAVRKHIQDVRNLLGGAGQSIVALQSAMRGRSQRLRYAEDLSELYLHMEPLLSIQGHIRGFLLRRKFLMDLKALQAAAPTIVQLQSSARGYVERQRTYDILCALHDHEDNIIALQSLARGLLCRTNIGRELMLLEDSEDALVELQAFARACNVRKSFAEKIKFFKENMQKVIKIQSFVRAKQQGEAYKTLIGGKNPPVGTVKNFVHLLNDSDFDFDEEIGKFTWRFLPNES
jgi:Ras GTPase-activating-like protein IQGAP2/3